MLRATGNSARRLRAELTAHPAALWARFDGDLRKAEIMGEPSVRKPALSFIFVTLLLSVVGFGLLIPVLPKLVRDFQGGDFSAGSHAYGWLVSIYAVMQFIG